MKWLITSLVLISNLCANDWQSWDAIDCNHVWAYVNDGLSGLDFSKIRPNLYRIDLSDRRIISWEPKEKLIYIAQDDAGLSKNVHLNFIRAWDAYSQTPISLSYLPRVETFEIFAQYQHLDYLSRALPNLKTVIYLGLFEYHNYRENFPIILNNISKLQSLENLSIRTYLDDWGARAFTIQELEAFSKMHRLKNLTLTIVYFDKFEKPTFDNQSLQLLKNLLPNTKVNIVFYLHLPQED